jgi:hypothetical protein
MKLRGLLERQKGSNVTSMNDRWPLDTAEPEFLPAPGGPPEVTCGRSGRR